MTDVNVKLVNCPYCIDMNGQNTCKNADAKVINSLYEIKELALRIGESKGYLDNLISLLETNLIRNPIDGWLEKNKEQLKKCIADISELWVLDSDTDETRENKIKLKTKLIELLES